MLRVGGPTYVDLINIRRLLVIGSDVFRDTFVDLLLIEMVTLGGHSLVVLCIWLLMVALGSFYQP
jgi:hypothetical protein